MEYSFDYIKRRKFLIEQEANSSQDTKNKFNELKIQLEQAFNNIQNKI